jgi:uncharacterized membrane protein
MKARVSVAGHSLHAMLVVFPLGLLATSVAWDICLLATGNPRWGTLSFWTILAGVIGGLVAAVPGFIDWLGIPRRTRARRIGLYHMALNLIVVGLFVVSLLARSQHSLGYAQAAPAQMIWGWIGIALALVSGWLGGELIERLGIAVHEGANPDAPSSLGGHEPEHAKRRRVQVPAHREA